ncbi:MAG: glycoside hydrolase family 5 protein [Chloroflexi bacterium]|nr:glycoside hydrolase family 5 protein [Chloroflexota bacterium]
MLPRETHFRQRRSSPWLRGALILALLVILVSCYPPVPMSPATSQVPKTRIERLSRGINLSHWFAQGSINVRRWQRYITAEDIALIKEMGFTHVRLPIEPNVLFNEWQPEELNPERLPYVDAALDMILAQDIAVIVDFHPLPEFTQRMEEDDDFAEAVVRFWGAFARHLSERDPEMVFLEAMNEPVFQDAARWEAVQKRILAAMREGAPEHTLIATGTNWSSIDGLLALKPVDDLNVVYNFHFYEPHTFTHQGARWGWYLWPYLHNVPYPSSPEAVEALLPNIKNREARALLRSYGRERWNAEKIERRIAQAAAWGRKYDVPLTCNEFGVYRLVSPPEDRLAWIRDVRTALEKYQIGWTMWDYAGGFSVVVAKGNQRVPDEGTLKALGLSD